MDHVVSNGRAEDLKAAELGSVAAVRVTELLCLSLFMLSRFYHITLLLRFYYAPLQRVVRRLVELNHRHTPRTNTSRRLV